MSNNLAIYIHWPFCEKKCPYCDFNSHVEAKVDYARFLNAFTREIQYFAGRLPNRRVQSIFFGGGTLSLMPAAMVAELLAKLQQHFTFANSVEITLEANPSSVEVAKLRAIKEAGVNRLSMGIQALNSDDLKFLGRLHSLSDAYKALEAVSSTFENYSFDLIYARPNQTLDAWEKELRHALKYAKHHLSLYQLTIEKGTPFFRLYQDKAFALPDEETAAELYELTEQLTLEHGLQLYEVSNYARAGYESKHNKMYWNYDEYIGIGAGAHGRLKTEVQGERIATMMVHDPEKWLQMVEANGVGLQTYDTLSPKEALQEKMMMGLRVREGLDLSAIETEFGINLLDKISGSQLQTLRNEGLLTLNNNQLAVTKKGRLLLSGITNMLCDW